VGCAKVLPVFHHIEPSRRRYVHHFNVAGHWSLRWVVSMRLVVVFWEPCAAEALHTSECTFIVGKGHLRKR
jgi:hypothetical protein